MRRPNSAGSFDQGAGGRAQPIRFRRMASACATCNARRRHSSTARRRTSAKASDMRSVVMKARRVTWMLLVAFEVVVLFHVPIAAAEVCYQDADGRIVTRRRPGYVEIECPRDDVAPPAETQRRNLRPRQSIVVRAAYARRRSRGRRNPVSPIPRPTMDDYVVVRPDSRSLAHRRHARLSGSVVRPLQPKHTQGRQADARTTGSSTSASSPTPWSSCATYQPPSASVRPNRPAKHDVFGGADQLGRDRRTSPPSSCYYKGDTVFKPPDYEFRFTPVINANYVELEDDARRQRRSARRQDARTTHHRRHPGGVRRQAPAQRFRPLRLRQHPRRHPAVLVGLPRLPVPGQPARRASVRQRATTTCWQYNIAWFRRIEKDTNSGLNDLGEACATTTSIIANLYWQDLPVRGFTSQVLIAYNRNTRERRHPLRSERFHRSARVDRRRTSARATTSVMSDTTATATSVAST